MRPQAFIQNFIANESGATGIEYALILAFIFLVIVSSVTHFAGNATSKLIGASDTIVTATD